MKCNKDKKKYRKILNSRQGVTLIELIVTFALISLFVILTSQAISSAMNVYYHIQGINMGRQVSDTLMDKITGQISGAQATVNKKETNVIISNGEYTEKESKNEDSSYLSVAEGEKGTMVDFYNQGNSHVTIKTKAFKDDSPEEKKLVIYYYPVRAYEEVNWEFDQKMYMGYSIKDLSFSWADRSEYPENIMKVELTISGKYGDYSTVRYVECYNLDSGSESEEPPSGGGDDGKDDGKDDDEDYEDGNGFIHLKKNGKDVLNIKAGKKKYKDYYQEFLDNGKKGFTLPAGVFKTGGEYYIIPKPVEIYADDMPDSLEKFITRYGKDKCLYVKKNAEIYTTDNWDNRVTPGLGDIYFYNKRYYLCYNQGPTKDPVTNVGAWADITDFVKIGNK